MTWKRKAKAIAAKHGWETEDFFQGGVSRVGFVRRIPGVEWNSKVMSVEFDRQLLDRLSEEPLWKGLCRLYFGSVPDAVSEAEIILAAEVSSDGC